MYLCVCVCVCVPGQIFAVRGYWSSSHIQNLSRRRSCPLCLQIKIIAALAVHVGWVFFMCTGVVRCCGIVLMGGAPLPIHQRQGWMLYER